MCSFPLSLRQNGRFIARVIFDSKMSGAHSDKADDAVEVEAVIAGNGGTLPKSFSLSRSNV